MVDGEESENGDFSQMSNGILYTEFTLNVGDNVEESTA